MITIIIRMDNRIEAMYEGAEPAHIVVIHEDEMWTDSPAIFTSATESEQAEMIANVRNAGYVDRNP